MSAAVPVAQYLGRTELEAGLAQIRAAPKTSGRLELIVRRPQTGAREVLAEAELTFEDGLAGDSWRHRRGSAPPDDPAARDCQLTIMSARVIALLAGARDAWPWAGDQLFVDLDLSEENLPAGTQLQIGTALVQVSKQPHTGCKKFEVRYGTDALQFVNSPVGRQLRLRGLNAKVIQAGTVRIGDSVLKQT